MEKAKSFGLIVAIFLIAFLLWSQCSRVPEVQYSNIIRTDTIPAPPPDTVNTVEVRWVDNSDTTTIHDTTTVLLIDSAKCLEIAKNYVRLLVYDRELVNDSNLKVSLTDSVQFNSLKSGIVRYELKKVTPVLNEKHFGIGGMTDFKNIQVIGEYNTAKFMFFGGVKLLKDSLNQRFSVGVIRRF